METVNQTETEPIFPTGYRGSGLLLPVASLPSRYGIGDMGPAAFGWIDRLETAGQQWWHALPLGAASASSFAANELLISPDILVEERLVRAADCEGHSFPARAIDYDAVAPFKDHLIELAWNHYRGGARRDLKVAFEEFRHTQAHWLDDYALFRALKTKFDGVHYLEWPAELALREPGAIARASHELSDAIGKTRFAQFLLFRSGHALKEYAHGRGIRLIGDLPFFISPDSSEVWTNPEYFQLDEAQRPRFVAGTPPDCVSSLGRRWGNPVYQWSALRDSDFRWHIDRLRVALSFVDLIRLEHFRGFAAAWHVPAGAPTAQCGQWVQGPGAALFMAVEKELGSLPFITDDLGMITADVWHLLDQLGAPCTRVLQCAFDGHSDNPHLPDNYVANTVAYTGTRDNPTTRGWYEKLSPHERRILWRYLKRSGGEAGEVAPLLMGLAWSSRAALAVAPLQDLLDLDTSGPWRATDEMLHAHAFEWLAQLTRATRRGKALSGVVRVDTTQEVCQTQS
jgi:4-alpha-glucanotransferase